MALKGQLHRDEIMRAPLALGLTPEVLAAAGEPRGKTYACSVNHDPWLCHAPGRKFLFFRIFSIFCKGTPGAPKKAPKRQPIHIREALLTE
jgi:hypothetical protein